MPKRHSVSGIFEPRRTLPRDKGVPHLVRSVSESKRLPAVFYRSDGGNEPVRQWMKREMSHDDRIKVGTDIRAVELCWPVGMPLCRPLSRGLWEIRTNLQDRIARVLFCVYDQQMVLLHGFIKPRGSSRRFGTCAPKKTAVGEGEMSKSKRRSRNIGSSFDEFLIEEGIWANVTKRACKKAISHLIAECMEQRSISKTEMAARMRTSRIC